MDNLKELNTKQLHDKLFSLITINKIGNQDKILTAYELAKKIHKRAKRDDGPYINHVLRVTIGCIFLGATEPEKIIAALLHDVIEEGAEKLLKYHNQEIPHDPDQIRKNALEIISQEFGEIVKNYVDYLTNPDWSHIKDEDQRKVLYAEKVAIIIKKCPGASLIKLADFYDNSLDLHKISNIKFRKNLSKRYKDLYQLFTAAINCKKIIINKEQIQPTIVALLKGWQFARKDL